METPTSLWSWPQAIVGTLLASIGAILGYLLRRKKLPSEVRKNVADAKKNEADADYIKAQADDLRMNTRLSATEMFSEMAADLGEAQFEKTRLKMELEKANDRIRVLEGQIQVDKANRMLRQLGVDESIPD